MLFPSIQCLRKLDKVALRLLVRSLRISVLWKWTLYHILFKQLNSQWNKILCLWNLYPWRLLLYMFPKQALSYVKLFHLLNPIPSLSKWVFNPLFNPLQPRCHWMFNPLLNLIRSLWVFNHLLDLNTFIHNLLFFLPLNIRIRLE